MSESKTQSTKDVLTKIAQEIGNNGSYEVTGEDETMEALGLPVLWESERKHEFDARKVYDTPQDNISVREQLYCIPNGDYVHLRVSSKLQAEHYTRYYIKGIGELNLSGCGIDKKKFFENAEEEGFGVNDEVYNIIDEFVKELSEEVALEDPYKPSYNGYSIGFQLLERFTTWSWIREEVDEALENRTVEDREWYEGYDGNKVLNGELEDDADWRTLRLIAAESIDTPNVDNITPEYGVDVDFDASHLLD
jgi:hypothetical protein